MAGEGIRPDGLTWAVRIAPRRGRSRARGRAVEMHEVVLGMREPDAAQDGEQHITHGGKPEAEMVGAPETVSGCQGRKK